MIETLTDEERETLSEIHEGCVALRVIDAYAADRAALVAQLEAANKLLAETTDDALKQRVEFWREACQKAEAALEAERADHDEFGQYKRAEALVAQVAELTRERDEARDARGMARRGWSEAQAEVTRLTRELEEARDDVSAAHQAHANAVNAKQAEVTRLTRELEEAEGLAECERRNCCSLIEQKAFAEARVRELTEALARANALLDEARDAIDEACWPVWWEKWRAYISGTSDTVCGACGHRASKPCGADDCPLQCDTIPRI